MSRIRPFHLVAVALAAAAAAACSKDNTSPPTTTVESDQQVSSDVVNSAGPAIAVDVAEINTNDSMTLAPPASADSGPAGSGFTFARHRTCYAGTTVQAACDSLTTDSIVIADTGSGTVTRSFTGPHGSDSATVALHFNAHVTASGLHGHETTRTYNGAGSANDTTHFTATADSSARTRTLAEADNDSVEALVVTLPRATNPWPTAGKIVRNAAGNVTVVGGANPGTRSYSRRVEVDFPADAQGNVTLKLTGTGVTGTATCSLNLSTRVVSSCTF